MNQGRYSGPNRDVIPPLIDSRELSQDGIGVIHVVKDVAQILPYCILKLTRGKPEDRNRNNVPYNPTYPSPWQTGYNPLFQPPPPQHNPQPIHPFLNPPPLSQPGQQSNPAVVSLHGQPPYQPLNLPPPLPTQVNSTPQQQLSPTLQQVLYTTLQQRINPTQQQQINPTQVLNPAPSMTFLLGPHQTQVNSTPQQQLNPTPIPPATIRASLLSPPNQPPQTSQTQVFNTAAAAVNALNGNPSTSNNARHMNQILNQHRDQQRFLSVFNKKSNSNPSTPLKQTTSTGTTDKGIPASVITNFGQTSNLSIGVSVANNSTGHPNAIDSLGPLTSTSNLQSNTTTIAKIGPAIPSTSNTTMSASTATSTSPTPTQPNRPAWFASMVGPTTINFSRPTSPSHRPTSPSHRPTSPSHCPTSPNHRPTSPNHRPNNPILSDSKWGHTGMPSAIIGKDLNLNSVSSTTQPDGSRTQTDGSPAQPEPSTSASTVNDVGPKQKNPLKNIFRTGKQKKIYTKRVLALEKYVAPLKHKIKDNPVSYAKLNTLLEIISNPDRKMATMATLNTCEETLRKIFSDRAAENKP